ncbi:MAG: hypothetical protein AAGF01_14260 [Cyanobacteria bacterium P01_G01_bin.38]
MMKAIYCFMNATLASRVIDHLLTQFSGLTHAVTVIYLIDRWILAINLKSGLDPQLTGDLKAFLNENGIDYQPSKAIRTALRDLDRGCSPTEVMNRRQVVIVSHGVPNIVELEAFRQRFIEGLGYCPQSLV